MTKLICPVTGAHRVQRPQVLSLPDEGLEKRMTFISAGAVHGMKTLAVHWFDQVLRRSR
jgi:ATP/maltotriose-dependent transcriptional regulator MalT